MGNASAFQVNVRSFKVIDPWDTAYQLFLLVADRCIWTMSVGLLSERRKSHRLQLFHKSVYNDIALPIPSYYQLSISETRNYSTNSFIQPSVHHDYYKYSFFPRTIRNWNCLLPETRSLNYSAFCCAKLS